jgi:hypothetical protein
MDGGQPGAFAPTGTVIGEKMHGVDARERA